MQSESIKRDLALIGAGAWGKNLARNFHEIGALHTLCDHHPETLQAFKEKFPEIEVAETDEALYSNPEIKKIAIAAPPFQHFDLAKKALLAGKDVFVEKPICMTAEEGEELVRIAEENDRILMVGHILHYHPCVNQLKELVFSGELGDIQYITSNRLSFGRYRTEENALWNFAPHDISVILSLFGDQLPETVRAVGEDYLTEHVEDTTLTTLKFSGKKRAHIHVSWLNPFKEQKLTVVGSKAMAVFDDTKPWGEKLLLYPNHVTWSEQNTPLANPVEPKKIDPIQKEPLKEECLHFIQSCTQKTPPLTDGKEGLRVLRVLESAQSSMKQEGKAIHLASFDMNQYAIDTQTKSSVTQ